jgi:hypothetical protein
MTSTIVRRIGGFAALVVSALGISSPASAGNGALLGYDIGYPVINFVSAQVAEGATYGSGLLTIDATPVFVTFRAGGPAEFIGPCGSTVPSLNIKAKINSSGVVTAEDSFTIKGEVIDTKGTPSTSDDVSYCGTLLSGKSQDYGIVNLGTTDLMDLKLKATGGLMLSAFGGNNAVIATSVTLEGSTFNGTFANWNAATVKGDLGPPVTTKAFPCFNYKYLKLYNRSGTTNDSIRIKKGGIRLDAGDTFNPAADNVTISFDGLVIDIPAGSFVQNGTKQDFSYQTASGVKPKIKMRLNFEKNSWEFEYKYGDIALVDTSDGQVKVTLVVGDYEGSQISPINHHGASGSSSSDQTAHPSCKLSGTSSDSATPGLFKQSTVAGMTVQTPSGAFIEKSRTTGGVFHPITPVSDPATGEVANFDTSGGTCLACGNVMLGDMGGTFTIMRIEGSPNDHMAQICGIYNASCDLLPPGQN